MQPAEASKLAAALRALLAHRSSEWSDWTVSYDLTEHGRCVLTARHPASHGLGFDLNELDAAHASEELPRLVAGFEGELRAVEAAPLLQHSELVLEFRSLSTAFDWSNREVQALTALLEGAGVLTHEEASWLADFEGRR